MFDPFGDFATRGYLRNLRGDTDPRVVKASEHNFFEANIEDALGYLSACGKLTYADFLEVHRILFCDFVHEDKRHCASRNSNHRADQPADPGTG